MHIHKVSPLADMRDMPFGKRLRRIPLQRAFFFLLASLEAPATASLRRAFTFQALNRVFGVFKFLREHQRFSDYFQVLLSYARYCESGS